MVDNTKSLRTNSPITWCPGCPDHAIMEAARKTILRLDKKGIKKEKFVMVSGIGCHGKIFDYLDISGFYSLHGRAIPTAMGIKLGNPNLKVLVFTGDGDTYSEGMGHFMSVGRFNPDINLIVNDNQAFSLTTGQSTPTSQKGFKNKVVPFGEYNMPINPLKLALNSGVSFIARCNARDFNHTSKIMEQAIKHKGFSYIEIIQDCIIFNKEVNNKDKSMYKLKKTPKTKDKASKIIDEWDYNSKKGKIALGVIYKENKPSLEEEWPQLANLNKKKVGWKDLKKKGKIKF